MDDDRLIQTSDLPLEREVLRAAATETVPPDVSRRALKALDLLMIAPADGRASLQHPPLRRRPRWRRWLRTGALGLGAGVAAMGAAFAFEQLRGDDEPSARQRAAAVADIDPPKPPSRVHASPTEPGKPEQADRPVGPPASSAPAADAEASKPRAPKGSQPRAQGKRSSPVPTAASEAGSSAATAAAIRDEIDLLDRARAALARGTPDLALDILERYAVRHPRGQLRAEVALVRSDAERARAGRASKTNR